MEIAHFCFDIVSKAGPINIIPTPSCSSWDDRLIADFVVQLNYDGKVVGVTDRLC